MQNETSDIAPAPKLVRARIIYSDFHLGQGRRPDGSWHPMEDFRSDREFAQMLRHLHESYAPDVRLELHGNGDVFDFMATPFDGKYWAVPTVEAAMAEIKLISDNHPEFFAALRWILLVRPEAEVIFTLGNHDQDLAWPEVQAFLRTLLAQPGQEHRVRFVRKEHIGPVDIYHGDEHDPLNAVPSDEEMFITDQKGGSILLIAFLVVLLTHGALLPLISSPGLLLSGNFVFLGLLEFIAMFVIIGWAWGKLYFSEWAVAYRARKRARDGKPPETRPKFMNYPYTYYMNAGLGMTLKRKFMPDMGRLQDHGAIWILTMARSPYWAPIIWIYLCADILFHMFFIDQLSVRRKVNLKMVMKILRSTTRPDQIDAELERYAKEHPDVKYVVAGHTHQLGLKNVNVAGRVMLYLNPGTWVDQRDMVLPTVQTKTSFPRLEAFFRRIVLYWIRSPIAAMAVTMVHLLVALLPYAVATYFGWGAGLWSYLIPTLSFFLLLWRFSYTEYRGRPFVKRTVVKLEEYDTGDIQPAIEEYLPPVDGEDGTGRFENAF
jgi:UDP-2,3-diacylglucosamine pyrophosphatase LpxH